MLLEWWGWLKRLFQTVWMLWMLCRVMQKRQHQNQAICVSCILCHYAKGWKPSWMTFKFIGETAWWSVPLPELAGFHHFFLNWFVVDICDSCVNMHQPVCRDCMHWRLPEWVLYLDYILPTFLHHELISVTLHLHKVLMFTIVFSRTGRRRLWYQNCTFNLVAYEMTCIIQKRRITKYCTKGRQWQVNSLLRGFCNQGRKNG